MLAFDHPTLHTSPATNAQWLRDRLPTGVAATFDVLAHSLSGLVTRCLAEGQAMPDERVLSVRRAVLAAAPNAGTHLAEPEHLHDLVDAYTNLLSGLPGVAVLEMLIAVIKEVVVVVAKALPGLVAMEPNGPALRQLNTPTTNAPTYFAVASDCEPRQPGLKAWSSTGSPTRSLRVMRESDSRR